MGIDLKLLPLLGLDHWAALDILQLERRHELWPEILALPSAVINEPLSCYETEDACYGEVETSAYGEPLRWVRAAQLCDLKQHKGVQDNWRNRAVWAYLACMPAARPIVLYWH